eukprot:2451744-Pleurochrysis_carterae.AAC.1
MQPRLNGTRLSMLSHGRHSRQLSHSVAVLLHIRRFHVNYDRHLLSGLKLRSVHGSTEVLRHACATSGGAG